MAINLTDELNAATTKGKLASAKQIFMDDGTNLETKLANISGGTAEIENGSITSAKLADNSVTTSKIASSAVTYNKIADGTIDYTKINQESIDNNDLVNIELGHFTKSIVVPEDTGLIDFTSSDLVCNPSPLLDNAQIITLRSNDIGNYKLYGYIIPIGNNINYSESSYLFDWLVYSKYKVYESDDLETAVIGLNFQEQTSWTAYKILIDETNNKSTVTKLYDLDTITNLDKTLEELKKNNLDKLTYGVSWKTTQTDPHVTRIGNMQYHKDLPIQNNMKGCIAQMKNGPQIIYYLNKDDWRFRADNTGYILHEQTIECDSEVVRFKNPIFKTKQYEHQWIKIKGKPFFINEIKIDPDESMCEAIINPSDPYGTQNPWVAGTVTLTNNEKVEVELGAVLNGYDGEVMVEVPEFWIKSWEDDNEQSVRISPTYIDNTWEHQRHCLVAAYHDTILRSVPSNMGYLSTLTVNSLISVCNFNTYCRGGDNSDAYDTYLSITNAIKNDGCFRTMLNKGASDTPIENFRTYARQSGKECLNLKQYTRILYWLYIIEYANFYQIEAFNNKLNSNGFKQGGLGEGIQNTPYVSYYNGARQILSNGYLNSLGNNSGYKTLTIKVPTAGNAEPTVSKTLSPNKYHGIEDYLGDGSQIMDGSRVYLLDDTNKIVGYYVTENPDLYSATYDKMELIGTNTNILSFVSKFKLGSTANIIPAAKGNSISNITCSQISGTIDANIRYIQMGVNSGGSLYSVIRVLYKNEPSQSYSNHIRTICEFKN